ncbi:adenine deaminase C-terminal domain-containing protein [Pseudobacillus badius]|uniref:adenine deaminase C-terminal domain-containing protein n=1 Tax=Bacillus badius TaxID=1455 RepID=UPI0007B079AA|nr:adenine deaminase C-terminal domain-containing protein [Bacillus badius]KZO01280.1 adenosine deaminase [Bacillus badius]OCS89518.1 adenosine deaminase [Bacillus badius]OVE49944.1 adenosine deaminase [Bacillus badius]TDW01087.1 adenine deaminase [Bacillus badius]
MLEQRHQWKNKQLREHVAVINGDLSPTLVLKNARFLHSALNQWMTANIWVYEDRIVYAGEEMPENHRGEIYDCSGKTLVPGYIEPHVHPFLLYNPQSFAEYAAKTGTTTSINDNLMLFLALEEKKAFSLLEEFRSLPVSMYWWCRYDGQTELENEEEVVSNAAVKSWIEHDAVVQGGELTGWPKLLGGDEMMLHWIQETKRLRKRIEGHFPGASEKTLTKMALLGADSDHESMSGQDIYKRLMAGYMVSLRHSSIRPDLEVLLQDMKDMGLNQYDMMMFTTDGASPSFYREGILDWMIAKAIEYGIPPIGAYHMASYNVARYYRMDHLHGMIAPGRIANINILQDEFHPSPVSVLSRGQWIKKEKETLSFPEIQWEKFGFGPLKLDYSLKEEDLQFSMPFGIELVNNVITKPYSLERDMSAEEIATTDDESFLVLLDRQGKWRVNTTLKGFTSKVEGLASSFSNTGDILLIGKCKREMERAFNRMKEIGGGIVLAEGEKVIYEIPLALSGIMSTKPFEEIMDKEEKLKELLTERGYLYNDPLYTLLFLSSTHLPYIRITPRGMYDVMKKTVLFPTIMR